MSPASTPSPASSPAEPDSGVPELVFLCGLPGSGKSTVGRLLAKRLGYMHLDTDHEVERWTGKSIPSLFLEGEAVFRREERRIVESTFSLKRHVVSLGGGSLGDMAFAEELRGRGTLVFIDVPVSVLLGRIRFTGDRPLLRSGGDQDPAARLETLAMERRPLYLMAQHHVIVDAQEPPSRTAGKVERLVKRPGGAPLPRPRHAAETPWQVGRGAADSPLLDSPYAVVVDERVAGLHRDWLDRLQDRNPDCRTVIEVPSGEASKSHGQWYRITGELLDAGMRRSDALVAVGGGVTGDLAGFVASTLLRGVDLHHVPTTLLAMVDSSLGGKTGINHESGKNLIGTFYPARRIVSDTRFLDTLPAEEWVNGFAEILKYAYIADPGLFEPLSVIAGRLRELEGRPPAGRGDSLRGLPEEVVEQLIRRSCEIKTDIVARDEHESGLRMHLNYGHTFAHALEHTLGYGAISHGTAVLVGMVCAAHLSRTLGGSADPAPLLPFLRESGTQALRRKLGKEPVEGFLEELMQAMGRDKKNRSSRIRLVLLHDHGRPFVHEHETERDIHEAWMAGFDAVERQAGRG